jgi:hypothetical protein
MGGKADESVVPAGTAAAAGGAGAKNQKTTKNQEPKQQFGLVRGGFFFERERERVVEAEAQVKCCSGRDGEDTKEV